MGAIQDILNKFGKETVTIIQGNLASTGTNATGATSASLSSQLVNPNRLQVTGKPFIYVVETGRKPGKMPPISAILKWVQTGKITSQLDDVSLAWAISKKIAREGSYLFRRGGRKDIITPAISPERVDKLTAEIATANVEFIVKSLKEK